jgi:hypothetical protein
MSVEAAESELMYLNNLNRTSEELVHSLEGVLVKFKSLNEGAAGACLAKRLRRAVCRTHNPCAAISPPAPCALAPPAGAKVMSEWDNVLRMMNSADHPEGFVAVPAHE